MVLPPWYILNSVKPGGEPKSMGSYTVVTFTKEQQAQFGVSETGEVVNQAQHEAGLKAHKSGGGASPKSPSSPLSEGLKKVGTLCCGKDGEGPPGAASEPRVGGVGGGQPADDDVREVLAPLKAEAEQKAQAQGLNAIFSEFEAICYTTQVVAGMNYFVKVKTGPSSYVHLRIYRHFSGTTQVQGIKVGCTREEPIGYF
eukprot:TRINITY_DN14558_c0_g1_i1.p3 TRINITY_DN14558_c0_g1~~TRINITY_DN14558_c0_g1_i1.p3  ORF type:complete len:220 (-),score=60.31 TRINITY_DN14558_c0_g1_i1:111-707(-)